MCDQYFDKKTFCVITGASQGFGRVMAKRFAEEFAPGSILVVTARNKAALESLKSEIESKCSSVQVLAVPMDMAKPDEEAYSQLMKKASKGSEPEAFQLALIIHNAGVLNDVSKPLIETDSVAELTDYFNLNLTSAFSLNCCFLRELSAVEQKLVINISSSAIQKPYPSCGLYCAVKAARHMYFKCLAADEPSVRVLNYQPGAMKTALFRYVASHSHNAQLRLASTARLEGKSSAPLLEPEQSMEKLIEILQQNKFNSGEQVDYYE